MCKIYKKMPILYDKAFFDMPQTQCSCGFRHFALMVDIGEKSLTKFIISIILFLVLFFLIGCCFYIVVKCPVRSFVCMYSLHITQQEETAIFSSKICYVQVY